MRLFVFLVFVLVSLALVAVFAARAGADAADRLPVPKFGVPIPKFPAPITSAPQATMTPIEWFPGGWQRACPPGGCPTCPRYTP